MEAAAIEQESHRLLADTGAALAGGRQRRPEAETGQS